MPENTIEVQDERGNKTVVDLAHWNRYPQLANTFRPVAEKKATALVATTETPTGDNEQEN